MSFESEDRIISNFLDSLGPFAKHVVVGGGYAPIIYRIYLSGEEDLSYPVRTSDIDTLIPRKLSESLSENIGETLRAAGFECTYKDLNIPATQSWRKSIHDEEVEVEFLTDARSRNAQAKNVKINGIIAQPLKHLEMSLEETVQFKTTTTLEGLVVSPAAWSFHKGLTFTKRRTPSKLLKDLYGMWYVLTQLESFSQKAFEDLLRLGRSRKKWLQNLRKNLCIWAADQPPEVWNTLCAQDPSGVLSKKKFKLYNVNYFCLSASIIFAAASPRVKEYLTGRQ